MSDAGGDPDIDDSDVSYEHSDEQSEGLDLEEDSDQEDEEDEDVTEQPAEAAEAAEENSQSQQDINNYKFIFGDNRNKKNKFLTKFEYARLIGLRASQIETNSPGPHEITKNHPDARFLTTALDIAKFELDNEEIPFPTILLRRINIGSFPLFFEVWDVRELKLPFDVQQEKKLGVKPYKISAFNLKSNV